jgi:hypothetical protein
MNIDPNKINQEKWRTFLTPDILKTNIILASIYITAFEILKDSIVSRVQEFYKFTFLKSEDQNIKNNPKYQNDVIKKDRSLVYASLMCLKELNAINDNDMVLFRSIRELRNFIAHEFPKILTDGLPTNFMERFNDIQGLLNKVEKWWIANFELPANPDFEGKNIDEKDIIPGRIVSLKILIDVAFGSEEVSNIYINTLKPE